MQDFHMLVQSLTRKVEEAEERYSLLQAQTDSLQALMSSEREQYSQKDGMYKQNVGLHKSAPMLCRDASAVEMTFVVCGLCC